MGVCSAKQPHVLLVVADDLGWGDVGFHGSEIRTPVLDKLAAEGVTLDNYYVQPVCSPTRTSLLTGRYPIRYGLLHHVYSNNERFALPTNETLLPEKMNQVRPTTSLSVLHRSIERACLTTYYNNDNIVVIKCE